jgi:hypothetical protein
LARTKTPPTPGAASEITVDDVHLTRASESHDRIGLIGWVLCTVDGHWCLDGLSLHRTRDGRIVLSFPVDRDPRGRRRRRVRPFDEATRKETERLILRELGMENEANP